ncbi:hypothetical protein [Streptomyces sp. NPDC020983]|uniref:hypothetical protein n=1 Tax=Streptomyces sp. NPDC020983 TaxID=3365106 RepID=UPI0037954755
MPVEFEDRFAATLRRAADTFAPEDPPGLVAAGHVRGRRMRRRRTIGTVAGVTALVAVAAGGVTAGAVLRHDDRPTAAAAPVATGEDTVRLLISLLPPGDITGRHGEDALEDGHLGGPVGSVHYRQGGRTTTVQISFLRHEHSDAAPPHCSTRAHPGTCKTLAVDGGTLMLTTSRYDGVYSGASKEGYIYALFSKGAYSVDLSQLPQGPRGTWDPSQVPPMDQAELTRIVTDKRWGEYAMALPRTRQPGSNALDFSAGVKGTTDAPRRLTGTR